MSAVIRITAESNLPTGSVNVWHWQIPNSAPGTEAGNAISALATFYTSIASRLATAVYVIGSRVVTVDQNPNQIIGVTALTANTTGTGTAVLSAAAVIRLTTPIVGGSRRGRKYLGPLASASVNANGRQLASGVDTALNSALLTLQSTTTGGIQLVVWSEKNRVATPVTGGGASLTIGTQRRRIT